MSIQDQRFQNCQASITQRCPDRQVPSALYFDYANNASLYGCDSKPVRVPQPAGFLYTCQGHTIQVDSACQNDVLAQCNKELSLLNSFANKYNQHYVDNYFLQLLAGQEPVYEPNACYNYPAGQCPVQAPASVLPPSTQITVGATIIGGTPAPSIPSNPLPIAIPIATPSPVVISPPSQTTNPILPERIIQANTIYSQEPAPTPAPIVNHPPAVNQIPANNGTSPSPLYINPPSPSMQTQTPAAVPTAAPGGSSIWALGILAIAGYFLLKK